MTTPDIERVLREHGPMLLRMAAAYQGRQAGRDELAQEMAVAVWQALPRFRGEGSLKSFVARVAQFTALDRLRVTNARKEVGIDELSIESVEATPEVYTETSQKRRYLMEAVRGLPTGQRECVLLVLEGFGNNEIADILGVAANTVDQRLSRARALLRVKLEEAK